MKYLIFFIAFLVTTSTLQAADFETGMTAYDTQRYRIAAREFTALAEDGDQNAQYMLGRLYRYGNGVLQDYVQAYKWFDIAATNRHLHARAAREAVSEDMTRNQLRQAQGLAAEWLAQHSAPAIAQPRPLPKPVISRETISAIQTNLNRLGYDAGPADGQPGNRTRNAIRAYQRNNSLTITGQPSAELSAHLDQHHGDAAQVSAPDANAGQQSESPWPRLLLADDFADGNYTIRPTWQVAAGQFSVHQLLGLHSTVQQNQFSFDAQTPGAVLLDLLQQTLRDGNLKNSSGSVQFAEIFLPVNITNSFGLNANFKYLQPDSHMEFGVYQSYDRSDGYRLIFNDQSGVTLLRLANTGNSVLAETRGRLNLQDGNRHHVEWLRYPDGQMQVTLDNRLLVRANDLSFRNSFRGFTLVNRGGDFGLRSITVHGTP